jgi:protein farnesyltransferase subunit beta
VLLEPIDPHPDPHKWMGIDVERLYRWASSMQGLPVEGGGFKGRTNKLVDGCYSWWVGGLFSLLEDIMGAWHRVQSVPVHVGEKGLAQADSDEWTDEEHELFNRRKSRLISCSSCDLFIETMFAEALQSFVLVSSQADAGGLRDKPGRPADAYHTLYNLSGLSAAQHHTHRPLERREDVRRRWVDNPRSIELGAVSTLTDAEKEARRGVFEASMSWTEEDGASKYVGGSANRVVSSSYGPHASEVSH